jgi:hypothetical protein
MSLVTDTRPLPVSVIEIESGVIDYVGEFYHSIFVVRQ